MRGKYIHRDVVFIESFVRQCLVRDCMVKSVVLPGHGSHEGKRVHCEDVSFALCAEGCGWGWVPPSHPETLAAGTFSLGLLKLLNHALRRLVSQMRLGMHSEAWRQLAHWCAQVGNIWSG